jgi:hypothetical protein
VRATPAWAVYSPCRSYRYLLAWPTGLANERIACGIFANPSTATEEQLDPTCRRWVNYCRAWGYGWAWVVNVRAWRETDPRKVPPDPESIGQENDRHILQAALGAELVVCGWGRLGGRRGDGVLGLLSYAGIVPHALKVNQDGSPCHPLYLSSKLKPQPLDILRAGGSGCATITDPDKENA